MEGFPLTFFIGSLVTGFHAMTLHCMRSNDHTALLRGTGEDCQHMDSMSTEHCPSLVLIKGEVTYVVLQMRETVVH